MAALLRSNFLADDSDLEKTEPASPRRIEKAREDGDVPRSRELATFAILISATLSFWITGEAMVRQLKHMLVKGLQFDLASLLDPVQLAVQWGQLLFDLLLVFAPMALLMLLAAIGSPMLIGGLVFSGKALGPNFGKLNPLTGLGNMFSLNSLTELLKAVAKTGVVGLAAWGAMSSQTGAVFALAGQAPATAIAEHGRLLLLFFSILAGAIAVIALIDAPYQMWQYSKKMMMTRQEVRDESKESEGNPEIKAKIRAQQREMSRRRMMAQVPNADVVVTNPTHYAVALKYPEDAGHAPQVVAKGMGEVAAKIREIALANHVVMLEAPALARILYKHTEISDEIPPTLYTAVAQVLAYVFQLRSYKAQGGYEPVRPSQIDVPAGMDPLAAQTSVDSETTKKEVSL
jgi:flagellar biosynthetic protein FlhB